MTQSELRKEIIRLREDKINMQRQRSIDLKLLTKLSIEASIKHSKLVTKNTDHSHNLLKLYTEANADKKRLHNVIDIKQREIDELHSKEMDLLWKLAHLEKNNGALQEYKDNNEKEIGYWEKKIMNHVKKKRDN